MPKILHLIPTLGTGGAERQLAYLAEAAQRFGADVQVGYLHEGPYLQRLLAGRVKTHWLGPLGNTDPRLVWKIFQLVDQVQPQLIQTWLTQMDILGGMAALRKGIPFIISERTSPDFYNNSWKNRVRVVIGKRAAAITANSMAGLQYWSAHCRDLSSPIQCVVPNAISFDEIKSSAPIELQDVAAIPFDELVLFAGRMISIKNLDRLVPALISVLNRRPSAVAVLLGDGPLAVKIAKSAAVANLGHRFRVLPFSDRIFGWLKRAHVVVSVSHFEGNPNTVLEAAACGCPLVVSDIAAHREILDEKSATFVSRDSSEAIALGIEDALENREGALERAERAQKLVADRNPEATARRYLNLYNEILQSTRKLS